MNQITVNHRYSCGVSDNITLPEGKLATDIKEILIKHGTITVTFNDGCEYSETSSGDVSGSIDWRRPASYEVFPCDEENGTDYSKELDFES